MPDDPKHLEDVICWKFTPDEKKLITVIPLTYARARINRGTLCGAFYDDGW
jgi:hypothetical protein